MLSLYSCVFKARSSILSYIFFILVFIRFSGLKAQEFFIHLEDSVYSPIWLNLQTIDSGYAHSGSYYSIADSFEQYGLGIESIFPEKYKNKNTLLKIEGWIKSSKIEDKASFVISLFDKKKQVYWQNFYFSSLLEETETWYSFVDSVKVPASITNEGKFKAYLWNNDLKDTIAIDDLKVSFTEITNPSFIPKIKKERKNESIQNRILLFENNFYKIYNLLLEESISIFSLNDSLLVKDFGYFIKSDSLEEEHLDYQNFIFKSVKAVNSGAKIYVIIKGNSSRILMELECNEHSPEIKFEVNEKYKNEQLVLQESIIINSEININEVFRSNRKSDHLNFQNEYWLDKQGVQFGNNLESIIIYHTPDVSSLQLNAVDNRLLINLDYEKDHPFLHFPLRYDTVDYKLDWSANKVNKGDRRKYSFSIFVGSETKSLPRFMKNPNGFLSTYIWTEHADFTNIRTNRATYFGSETITNADSSTGGFVKYNIPVTKSIFYANPDSVTNSNISNGTFSELESSIKSDNVYLQFIQQVRDKGSEICLHTPENFTTNKADLDEALRYMQNEFQSPIWIDHGYNNGLHNNREDLVCDGTLKKSSYYSMDLWEKYGVYYFWNPYYEDYFTYENWKFGALMTKPYSGFGDFIPNPDYWRNKSRTGNLIHWPTKSVLFVPDDHLWEYNFSEMVLNEFVESWGVEINHCYPAWVDTAKGFWIYDADSNIVAAPGLNRTLERMAELRDQKKMNVTIIKDFLDYQLAIENINYNILPDGRIKVTNRNSKPIKGLSFATKAKRVLVNDKVPNQKIVHEDIIFWFDLSTRESKLIRTID